MKHTSAFLALMGLSLVVAGCTPVSVGATLGTTAGVAAAREGGLKSTLEDTRIRAKINELWLNKDFDMFRKVNLTVDQGRVLLTGVVQKQQHRVEAVRLAWQPTGVRQVINEIKVDNSDGIKGWARDNWISGRLRATILFDKEIQSVNYSIDTVQGVIYLMGISQTQQELNAVITHARSIPYVTQVVSYVKLAGTPMGDLPATGAAATTAPQGVVTMPVAPSTAPVGSVSSEPLTTTTTTQSGATSGTTPIGKSKPIVDGGF